MIKLIDETLPGRGLDYDGVVSCEATSLKLYLGHRGRVELLVVHQREGHELSLLARHSLRDGGRSHAGIQIGYALPISSYLKGYIQVFNGYGASLLDYNHRQTRIGIGISMMQWL